MFGSLLNPTYRMLPYEYGVMVCEHFQHREGVKVRMNPRTFRVEYVNPDGSIVPDKSWFVQKAYEDKIHHDPVTNEYTVN